MAKYCPILGLPFAYPVLRIQQWIINCYNVAMNIFMNLALSGFSIISLGEIPRKLISMSKNINILKI